MKTSEKQPKISVIGAKNQLTTHESITSFERNMEEYNNKLEKTNSYMQKECQHELEKVKKAERKLQEKIKEVMRCDKMKEMENDVYEASVKTSKSMRNIQRDLQDMHYEIEDSNLSDKEKEEKIRALNTTVAEEYQKIAQKFPAAMKAQILSQISNSGLLM